MKIKRIIMGALLATGVAASSSACSNNEDSGSTTLTNKEKVVQLLNSIETHDKAPVTYINPSQYTQHNLGVADGLAGFGAVLGQLANYPESPKVNVVRAFQDGDYVFTHTNYNFFGPKIGFDVFRFQDGLIVEHWDNLAVTPANANPSGHSMIDGSTAIKDLDKTAENKILVENFIKEVFIGGDFSKLTYYINSDQFIQHNPNVADGIQGLQEGVQAMKAHNITMHIEKVEKVLGEGNFVLVISEGKFGADGGALSAFYDLFRIENGKIVEHWDVIEAIPAESEWKNQNGKFGFK